jgi:hypothetical protein
VPVPCPPVGRGRRWATKAPESRRREEIDLVGRDAERHASADAREVARRRQPLHEARSRTVSIHVKDVEIRVDMVQVAAHLC